MPNLFTEWLNAYDTGNERNGIMMHGLSVYGREWMILNREHANWLLIVRLDSSSSIPPCSSRS